MSSRTLTALVAIAGISCVAPAQNPAPYTFGANEVLPVSFDQPLSVKDNQPGDEFTATVTDDNGVLPRHTKVDGHVVRILWGNRHHSPSMDLHFDDIRLPNGQSQKIDAVPVPLNSKFIRHDRDGRMSADPARMPVGAYEAVGGIGGLVVGGLFNRPFLGSVLGSIAGLAAGIAAHQDPDRYLVAKRGSKVGMLIRLPGSAPMPGESVAPGRHFDVRVGDHMLRFPSDQQPYWEGQTLMVPLPYMSDQMDLSVDQRADGPIFIENRDNTLRLTQGSDQYRLNGHNGTLPAPVENQGDLTFVPVDILAAIATGNVYVNGTKLPKNS
ncbi:MAG TPA: stalk domain-containing protein [Fimbriimonadaceae bacterium]|jgi:hypothetical protein